MLKAQKCDRLDVHFTYRVRKSGKLFSLHTLNRLSISAKYAFAYNVGYFYKKGGSRGKLIPPPDRSPPPPPKKEMFGNLVKVCGEIKKLSFYLLLDNRHQ